MIILDGKKVSQEKLKELKEKIAKLNRKPGIAIIKIGNDKPSEIYVKRKEKIAQYLNYNCLYLTFNENDNEEIILNEIKKLNNNNKIDGIIIELPLPKHLNKDKIINTIDKDKDIDGLTLTNRTLLARNNHPIFGT